MFSVILGTHLGTELLGHLVTLTPEELANWFAKWLHWFTFPPAMNSSMCMRVSHQYVYEGFIYPRSSSTFVILSF